MLKHLSALFLIAGLSASPVLAGPPTDVLTRALDQPAANMATGYRYYRTTVVHAMGEPAGTEIERFDPTKPDGKKWEKLSSTMADKVDKNSNGVNINVHRKGSSSDNSLMGYDELKRVVTDSDATLVTETADLATYRLVSKPGHLIKMGGIDFESDATKDGMTGEMYVRKTGTHAPYVSGVKMHLIKPVRTPIVDIPKLAFGYGYAPEGKTGDMVLKAFGFDMQMKMPIVPKIKVSVSLNNSGFEAVTGK
jgi:hypothetical protein